jgi:hypothetical protein
VEEALFAGEEEKKGRERNDGWLTFSSAVENEASDFFLLPPDVRVPALPKI